MHLTVRMAWHDHNWNGQICDKPEENTYCVGTHSLLSGRIEKGRDLAYEMANASKPVCDCGIGDVPPCYWSINAFGTKDVKIQHTHAFSGLTVAPIKDVLKPNSVLTWPFKLSFVHDKKNAKKFGSYPPDLENRIEHFRSKFKPKESIVFFYANYDNPVSAEEMRYLLLGCSVISEIPEPKKFEFEDRELERVRRRKNMQNFPTINWAVQVTHDPEKAILLPYREYVRYTDQHPDTDDLLNDIKVVIEEDSLVSGFKYVAMDIDDDKCLYLLYKIRKAIKKLQEHKKAVVKSDFAVEEKRIADLIQKVWKKRGIYPSLANVLRRYLPDDDCEELATALEAETNPKLDLKCLLKTIVDDEEVPESLEAHEDALLELAETRAFKKNLDALVKLSLFQLTDYQISKILENAKLLKTVQVNPYVLYEDYWADADAYLDDPNLIDEPIDLYKVDIGMIPDRKFVKRHRELQNIKEDSPERIRAAITNYLTFIGQNSGHCYDHIENVLNDVEEYPLIYRNEVQFDRQAIIDLEDDYKSHFVETLHLARQPSTTFFYLKRIYDAERQIRGLIESLINRSEHRTKFPDFSTGIRNSAKKLAKKIPDFDSSVFVEEREQLFANILKKSFFLLTGRPGSGKTFEISNVISNLIDKRQEVLVLAPTGKAALRLSQNIAANTGKTLKADTIDRYLFKNGFGWAYDDWEKLDSLPKNEKLTVENLIIDESSMLDLEKVKILFGALRFDENFPKRLIFVGDENQLPPIGFGKPFHDMIRHVQSKQELISKHYVNLQSNCRQENDPKIVQLAEIFTDKTRYYEPALQLLNKVGKVSDGLDIYKWKDRDELMNKLLEVIEESLPAGKDDDGNPISHRQRLNRLFGLYDNGNVNNQGYQFQERLKLDVLQCLTPYRGGHGGAVSLNGIVQAEYRRGEKASDHNPFYHSDKIIRIKNWYRGFGEKRELILSNGSLGIVNGGQWNRKYYFADADKPFFSLDSEENVELAYAITVHKSQGSDFEHVLLVIPAKLTLLQKEMIYTALTRSRKRMTIFVQDAKDNLFEIARSRSSLLGRNTSLFSPPEDHKRGYIPAPGKKVQSKIEFIIYQALERSGLKFAHEKKIKLDKRSYEIKPDFTICVGDKKIYWEHLGMLDCRKYYRDWMQRKIDYQDHGIFDFLVTTDDLEGIVQQKIDKIIDDIREGTIAKTKGNAFSDHHYELY